MKEALRQWWPAVPAFLILYLGAVSLIAKYPHASGHMAERSAGSAAPDSLLAYVRALTTAAPASAGDSLTASESPFRPIHTPRPQGQGPAIRLEPPPRRYALKGTVGTDVATITNNAGQKEIVKVGDGIDSAEVVSIETNKVVLKDRAGKFELYIQK